MLDANFLNKHIIKKIDNNHISELNNFLKQTIYCQFTDSKKEYPEGIYDHEFNSAGYRCDEFTSIHEEKHIVFMGCSETQGCNQGLDETWAYILYNKILEKEKLSGYFNIAVIGDSILRQVFSLFNYIEKYGKPKEIYFLAPDALRTLFYATKNFTFVAHNLDYPRPGEHFEKNELLNAFFQNVLHLKSLEEFCKNSDIKLIWSTWSEVYEDIFENLGFKNFFNLNMKNVDDYIIENYDKYANSNKSLQYNLRKSDGHRGLIFHRYWAEKFYENRQK